VYYAYVQNKTKLDAQAVGYDRSSPAFLVYYIWVKAYYETLETYISKRYARKLSPVEAAQEA